MSPISVELTIAGKVLAPPLPDIIPKVPACYSQYDPEHPGVIVVSCNPGDDGGVIYRLSDRDTFHASKESLRAASLHPGDLLAIIGLGERRIISLHTQSGVGELMLRHH